MARQPNLIFHYSVCSILCQGKSAFLQYIKYAGFKLITNAFGNEEEYCDVGMMMMMMMMTNSDDDDNDDDF